MIQYPPSMSTRVSIKTLWGFREEVERLFVDDMNAFGYESYKHNA